MIAVFRIADGLLAFGRSRHNVSMRCVYCLIDLDKPTKDHVFPKSWYPESTPENIQRWTVPCCADCNGSLSKIERDLLLQMGPCVDPAMEEGLGIAGKVKRSLGIGMTNLQDREAVHRNAQKRKFLTGLRDIDPMFLPHTLPGFGPHEGFEPKVQKANCISPEALHAFVVKVIRGAKFVLDGRYIEDPYTVEVYFPNDSAIPEVEAGLSEGSRHDLGPGLELTRKPTMDDPMNVIYCVRVWGTLTSVALILPSE